MAALAAMIAVAAFVPLVAAQATTGHHGGPGGHSDKGKFLFYASDGMRQDQIAKYADKGGVPGFREMLPYVYAIVELAEGVRMPTNVVGCPPDAVRIGMPVEVVFEDVAPEITLPKFRPVS